MEETENGVIQLPGDQLPKLIQKAFENKITAIKEEDNCVEPEVLNYQDFFKYSSLQNVGTFKEGKPTIVNDKDPRIFVNGLDDSITQTIETTTASTQMFSVTSEKSFSFGLSACLGAAMCADGSMEGGLEYGCSEEITKETLSCKEWKSTVDLIIPPKKRVTVTQNKIITTSKANCILKVEIPENFTFECKWLSGSIPSCESLGIQLDSGKNCNTPFNSFTSILTDGKETDHKPKQTLKLNTFNKAKTSTLEPEGDEETDGGNIDDIYVDTPIKPRIVEDSHREKKGAAKQFRQKSIELKAKEVFDGEHCYKVCKERKWRNKIKTITCYIQCEVTRKIVNHENVYSQSD